MNLESKKSGEFIFLKPLKQNIDATTSSEFKARVFDFISQGHYFFVLNLSQVEFIDSSGLGAMLSILKALKGNNGDIVLCELKSPIENLFKITHMNKVFTICLNEKQGLESIIEIKENLNK